jgi:hypothetical protein
VGKGTLLLSVTYMRLTESFGHLWEKDLGETEGWAGPEPKTRIHEVYGNSRNTVYGV